MDQQLLPRHSACEWANQPARATMGCDDASQATLGTSKESQRDAMGATAVTATKSLAPAPEVSPTAAVTSAAQPRHLEPQARWMEVTAAARQDHQDAAEGSRCCRRGKHRGVKRMQRPWSHRQAMLQGMKQQQVSESQSTRPIAGSGTHLTRRRRHRR